MEMTEQQRQEYESAIIGHNEAAGGDEIEPAYLARIVRSMHFLRNLSDVTTAMVVTDLKDALEPPSASAK